MKQTVTNYINHKKDLMDSFNCQNDYYIQPITEYKWDIKKEEDVYILSYWEDEGNKTDLVIVKKNGEPIIFNNDNYTMIIGINCIKIAYIVKNKNKIK